MKLGSSRKLERFKKLESIRTGVPGAIVIGGDYQGLGIVRSLGRKGVPICILDDEYSISQYSRYATYGIRVPDLRNEGNLVETLLFLGRKLGLNGWVIFPTRDELVATLSRHKAALSEVFRVPTPAWETVKWVWNKRNTYRLAHELEIPIPETWSPDTFSDLDAITTPFPLALKPGVKDQFLLATKAKAWRADNPVQLRELFARAIKLTRPGELLIQDLIPGDGKNQYAYCAFFKDGKAVGSVVSQRLRQHPREFGRASTYVETVELPILESLSERFLRAINYYGLVEVEFKLDPRDGQFKLLDVNARTWGYHTLGSAAGVDFPHMLYLDQIGKEPEPSRGKPGLSWIRLLTDLPAGLVEIGGRRLKLRDYIQSVRKFHTEAVFSKEDPFPGIVECLLLPYLMLKRGY
jgi:predicted ATP-grasp superfamily ATP-dependent carboligase